MKYKTYISLIFLGGLLLVMMSCGKDNDCVEELKPDCLCTMQYDPVCGCNDKTYGNDCMADCAGIISYTKGKCN
jgi:hypothetical protein